MNLPYSADDRQGNRVVYKVRTTVSNTDHTPAPGRELVWVLESDPGNTDLRYLPTAKRAKLKSDHSTSDQQAWAHNTLTLPHVGGDKYKVKVYRAGDDPATARLVDDIVTWRKIYYTTHYVGDEMKRRFRAVKARMIAGFAPAFVKLEEVAVLATPEVTEDAVSTSNDLKNLYQSHQLGYKPWHVRIVVARNLVDNVSTKMDVDIQHDTNTAECVVSAIHTGFRAVINTQHDILGDDPISSLRAIPFGLGSDGNWKSVGAGIDVKSKATKTGPRQVTVDLSSFGSRLNPALRRYPDLVLMEDALTNTLTPQRRYTDGAVMLYLTYNRAGQGGVYNGHSFGNFVCVRGHRPGAGTDAEIETMILGTFVHEIGHGLQQTVKEEQLYDGGGAKVVGVGALEKNYTTSGTGVNEGPWHTNDQGGQGPHCATNATLDGSNEWDYDPVKGQLCTMYFAGSVNRTNGVFCANCLPRLKRADLSQLNMANKNWNYT